MKILIDNGHGAETSGKRSPDGRFLEYKYNRDIACGIVTILKAEGYDAELLVPEARDVSLLDRVSRVNAYSNELGKENVILISIHCNAAGNGLCWCNAQGWSAYTSRGQTEADTLADYLYDAALVYFKGRKIRRDYIDGDEDFETDFYILKHTLCPACLTESFFYDNKDDLRYLESQEGKSSIIGAHVAGIRNYVDR